MACSVVAIRLSCELKGTGQAKADTIVTVRRPVVVAVRGTAVLRVVVPTATAIHAVVTFWPLPFY